MSASWLVAVTWFATFAVDGASGAENRRRSTTSSPFPSCATGAPSNAAVSSRPTTVSAAATLRPSTVQTAAASPHAALPASRTVTKSAPASGVTVTSHRSSRPSTSAAVPSVPPSTVSRDRRSASPPSGADSWMRTVNGALPSCCTNPKAAVTSSPAAAASQRAPARSEKWHAVWLSCASCGHRCRADSAPAHSMRRIA